MREMLQLMVQLVVLGLIFLAAVPLAAVLLFGQLGQAEGPDLQLPFRDRVNTPDTITVWLEDQNKAVTVDFEAYVCRVVASEMPSNFETEALKAQAKAELPGRVAYWSKIMGVQPTGVRITTARKRYGSCSSKHSLCFSCYLMRSPEAAVDLVVVHELCHIREMNHGPRFYALLEQYLPDWKERKKLLK